MRVESFLTAVEATKGETLTSVVLAYLIRLDDRFLTTLFEPSDGFDFDIDSTPNVDTEVATKSVKYGDGRLDIVIEVPESLIVGIENKIWASFEPNQPIKYCEALFSRIKSTPEAKAYLLVLAPNARRSEVEKKLLEIQAELQEKQLQLQFVSWEKLLARLKNIIKDIKDEFEKGYLVEQLKNYINREIWFDKPLIDVFQAIYRKGDQWNEDQETLVKAIWHLFPDQGARIEKSHGEYIGYRFYRNWEQPASEYVYGWYGFVNTESQLNLKPLEFQCRPVEFVINCDLRIDDFPETCRSYLTQVDFSPKHWSNLRGWIVRIGDDWSVLKWEEKIKPLLDRFYQALPKMKLSQ